MSDQQKRELVDQIGWIMVQANANPAIIFQDDADTDAVHEAEFFLDDFNGLLLEYRQSLSVAQSLRNSGHAITLEEVEKFHPELVKQARALPYNPIRSGLSFIDLVTSGKEEAAITAMVEEMIPTETSVMKEQFERQGIAAKAPVFTMPKGIKPEEFRKVCDDIQLLVACHQQSWQYVFDPDRVLDEDEDADDLPSDQDRLGFYGCFQWLSNVVDAVRAQFDSKSAFLEAASVVKIADGRFKPPGVVLN